MQTVPEESNKGKKGKNNKRKERESDHEALIVSANSLRSTTPTEALAVMSMS